MKATLKALNKKIKETNEKFKNAPKSLKRVMVAQDCIDRIKLKQLEPMRGITVDEFALRPFNGSLKDLLGSRKTLNCEVCAKGGLFMAYVGRANEFDVEDVSDDNSKESPTMKKLLEIFGWQQLSLIEVAFEGRGHTGKYEDMWHQEGDSKFNAAVENFYYKYRNPDKRLIAICENIIHNNGKFRP